MRGWRFYVWLFLGSLAGEMIVLAVKHMTG